MSDPILIFPEPGEPDVIRTLEMAGYTTLPFSSVDEVSRAHPDTPWAGAVVSAHTNPDSGWAMCRELRRTEDSIAGILVLVSGSQLADLESQHDYYDDFLITPFHPRELEARVHHLQHRLGHRAAGDLVEHGPLKLNLETYQAIIDRRPLDLTFMEYELLKYLASNPGKVFSREALLNQVWGYEYFGGARTVDVHIRRLRAKFGEEHAQLIQTVRSVGYKLGEPR